MDIEEVRKSLSPAAGGAAAAERDALPARFYDAFVLNGLHLDIIEPGRVVCSMTVPPRLVNSKGYLHGGVIATLVDVVGSAPFYSAGIGTSGVSLEISTSFVDAAFADEEIEIEAKLLNAGKSIGVCSVELRRKKTGKIIARARHTKYIAVSKNSVVINLPSSHCSAGEHQKAQTHRKSEDDGRKSSWTLKTLEMLGMSRTSRRLNTPGIIHWECQMCQGRALGRLDILGQNIGMVGHFGGPSIKRPDTPMRGLRRSDTPNIKRQEIRLAIIAP